jgi:hypothetical protein
MTASDSSRLAILCVVGFAIVNAAFYFLSGSYFDSHHEIVGGQLVATYSADQVQHIRVVFAGVSGAVTSVAFVAALSRNLVSHVLAGVLGAFNLVAGLVSLQHSLSGALIATLLITGALMPLLAWFSYRGARGARGAWAFLVALCGVLAVVGLFGAPKIRNILDVSLWTTMILPGLFAVACISLALLRDRYVERAARTAA